MEGEEKKSSGYGKRPLWQWILIYLVVGGVVYGLVYYFVIAKKGGYTNTYGTPEQNQNSYQQTNPTSSDQAVESTVTIANYSYSPATLTIKVGDTVTWTNQDSVGHTATADDNSFDTGILTKGKSGTITFNKAGTYPYHCTPHPVMKGTIIVE